MDNKVSGNDTVRCLVIFTRSYLRFRKYPHKGQRLEILRFPAFSVSCERGPCGYIVAVYTVPVICGVSREREMCGKAQCVARRAQMRLQN